MQLGAYAAEPLDYLEVKIVDQAWVTWGQTLATAETFVEMTDWHRSLLEPLGWREEEETQPGGTPQGEKVFGKDEWKLTLTLLPGEETPSPLRFRRHLEWNREFSGNP